MMHYVMLGGPLMWPILLCGLIVLVVLIERLLHLHRARIKTDDFLMGLANILARGNVAEALSICDETPGPVAAIARAAIRHKQSGAAGMRRAMDTAALLEMGRMERRAAVLAVGAQIAPLLGLLGTIVGLVAVLTNVQQQAPLVHAGDLAGGFWQALLSSAAGLAVAILGILGYNLIMARLDTLALDMEQSTGELLAMVEHQPPASGHEN